MKQFKSIYFFLLLFFSTNLFSQNTEVKTYEIHKILALKVNTIIGPAVLDYLQQAQTKAIKEKHDLILLEINTPGGLLSTTKDILAQMGESNIPYVVWVRPAGASATSAGAIIAAGAHVLVMSEGTNIGAATPINLNGENIITGQEKKSKDVKENNSDLARKAHNDLRANIESLAQLRGRNAQGFAQMIDLGSSFNANQAQKEKLIDGIANNRDDLIKILNSKVISIKGKSFSLKTSHLEWIDLEMDLGQKILNVFASPIIAYILFLLGCALIYFELQAPGGYVAGGIGAMAIIMAGLGLQILPINFGGLGLIVVAFACFIVEIYVTSFGLLAIVGLIALYFGSSILYHVDDVFLSFPKMIIYSTMAAITSFMALITYLLKKERAPKENLLSLINLTAVVISAKEIGIYQVKVHGEIWKAKSNEQLKVGDSVLIENENKKEMILNVRKNLT